MGIEWNNVTWYSKAIAIAVYVITFGVAFSLGGAYNEFGHEKKAIEARLDSRINHEAPVSGFACPADARACPDGTTVTRTGPNCTFASCPPENAPDVPTPAIPAPTLPPEPDTPSPIACTMDAKVCPDGSAVGRTGPNCEFAPCP